MEQHTEPTTSPGPTDEVRTAETYLVGVDGSEPSQTAVHWTLRHCRPDDTIVLAHVWQIPVVGGLEIPVANLADFEVAARRLIEQVRIEAEAANPNGAKITTAVRSGGAGAALVSMADEADHLVVGSRGHGGLGRMFLGSVSTYAVHHAPCPVVVVPADRPDRDVD